MKNTWRGEKIKWDLEKEKFLPWVTSVLICNICGWLIQNPRPGIDKECCNCGEDYEETHSEIQHIRKEAKNG